MSKVGHPLQASERKAKQTSPTFMDLPFVSDLRSLDIAVVGIPWDGGTSLRVGSRHGPGKIRNMSSRLRSIHPTFGCSPFEACVIGDVGDVRISPFDQAESLAAIEAFYADLAVSGPAPLTAGGDHLITLPILRGIARKRPLAVVQFDAHSDTADMSPDGNRFAASTPFRRAIEEGLIDPKRMIQIGIRGTLRSREKMEWARGQGIRQFTVDELYETGLNAAIDEIRRIIGRVPTYVTFDVDGIDPAFAPGTGTPVVGGITSYEAQRILRGLDTLSVIGGDVVEVSPPYDVGNTTSLLGASLLYEILCLTARTRAGRGIDSTIESGVPL